MYKALAGAFGCMFLPFIFSCADSPPASRAADGRTLVYSIVTEPDHLDPFLATSADSRYILFNCFEGLLKPAPDGSLVPGIAESYEVSDDFMSYTFRIRDALFHDGSRVSAADVVYSLEQARLYGAAGMDAVSQITEVDDRTVRIGLSDPDSEFYYNLTTAIVPAGYADQNSRPVGTGPFKFESFTPQRELVFVRHDGYWGTGLPKIDRLVFSIKPDYRTALFDLYAGSVNSGFFDTVSALQADAERFSVVYDNSNSVQMLALNNAEKPFDDVRVRRALSYAINIEEIIALAHNGRAQRAASPVIPGLKNAYNGSLDKAYTYDIEKAKDLLAEAGYGGGFTMKITVPSAYRQHADTAQIIAGQLAKVGITAEIRQVDWAAWLSEVYTERRYQATVVSVDGTTLSPRSYLERYVSDSPVNFCNYADEAYDALFHKALKAKGEAERMEIYRELQSVLSGNAVCVFICDMAVPKIFRKDIKGYVSYPLYILDASTLYFD